ncbi:uncharacterized protein TNIN_208101 [Trichonephila inaurata madagascariensis]|uniref:Uncharacterized protein n=1 Tax=Trichonephila inaurata madagascariensis TaxID=2747483 RepID=A0A8X6X7A4_9ARAC|nr:uncharacterized protein TNIN_453681 [Trichonephila inaurata madagascariensis]GFY50144.1 uncharacterized protein TNIN_208101 [Trichonephila inaurata madagascariensis]
MLIVKISAFEFRVFVEKQIHPQYDTVWCGGIIEPYFFENNDDQAANVMGARYHFLLKLDDIDVDNIWFQQDSAASHTACEIIQYPLVSVIRIIP